MRTRRKEGDIVKNMIRDFTSGKEGDQNRQRRRRIRNA
jgi:hypothetical protein